MTQHLSGTADFLERLPDRRGIDRRPEMRSKAPHAEAPGLSESPGDGPHQTVVTRAS